MSREYLERRLAEIKRQHLQVPRERAAKHTSEPPRRQVQSAPPILSRHSAAEAVEPLFTLDDWARLKFGARSPTRDTLRRWVREDRIYPRPKKYGRAYFLPQHAEYLSDYSDTESLQGART